MGTGGEHKSTWPEYHRTAAGDFCRKFGARKRAPYDDALPNRHTERACAVRDRDALRVLTVRGLASESHRGRERLEVLSPRRRTLIDDNDVGPCLPRRAGSRKTCGTSTYHQHIAAHALGLSRGGRSNARGPGIGVCCHHQAGYDRR
ncbi:hypothetical protein Rmf_16620 [Roseomonas fluvialis]|uniref:Uncharacterized protein n=1 Tax=Roseomonas fluvialis TaxID=1750527 RepID=A0ABM7Y1P4_9PROT|nr:hypothetical protein Rmf_16620 [Roseomonas fluvialis]